jgi:hypothetical protein
MASCRHAPSPERLMPWQRETEVRERAPRLHVISKLPEACGHTQGLSLRAGLSQGHSLLGAKIDNNFHTDTQKGGKRQGLAQ